MTELTLLARPYAKALFELALETETVEQWSALLDTLSSLCDSDIVVTALANPSIDQHVKASWFEDIPTELGEQVTRYTALLARNGRLTLLPNIRDMFHDYVNEQHQSEEIEVFSAYTLNQCQLDDIQVQITNRLNKHVSLVQHQDTSLIGGVRIQGKGWVIDASLAGQIKSLAQNLNV